MVTVDGNLINFELTLLDECSCPVYFKHYDCMHIIGDTNFWSPLAAKYFQLIAIYSDPALIHATFSLPRTEQQRSAYPVTVFAVTPDVTEKRGKLMAGIRMIEFFKKY